MKHEKSDWSVNKERGCSEMMDEITLFLLGALFGHIVSQWFSYKSKIFHFCNQFLVRQIDGRYQLTKRGFLSIIGYKQREDPPTRHQLANMITQIDPKMIENFLNNICNLPAPEGRHGSHQHNPIDGRRVQQDQHNPIDDRRVQTQHDDRRVQTQHNPIDGRRNHQNDGGRTHHHAKHQHDGGNGSSGFKNTNRQLCSDENNTTSNSAPGTPPDTSRQPPITTTLISKRKPLKKPSSFNIVAD